MAPTETRAPFPRANHFHHVADYYAAMAERGGDQASGWIAAELRRAFHPRLLDGRPTVETLARTS
jgi:hypothetical protein